MTEDPVKEGGGEIPVAEDFCPVLDILISGEDEGGPAIGTADEVVEGVGLRPGNRCIADLIQDHHIGTADFLHAEAGRTVRGFIIQQFHEVIHYFKGYRIARVDSQNTIPDSQHCFTKPGRPREDDISVRIEPVQVLQTMNLRCCEYTGP